MSSYLLDGYHRESAAFAPESARLAFMRRTYGLLLLAVLAFIGLEAFFLKTDVGLDIVKTVVGSRALMIGTLVLFIASGFVARYLARSDMPPVVQLLGLGLYVLVQAIIFLPFMFLCTSPQFPQLNHVPLQAGVLTLVVFGGLTAVVFISKKDFSFMGKMLMIASFVALGVIILSLFTPLNLGIWFSAAIIALACGYIIYDTSNVLHHYPVNAHVAAALELFASVALLFFYIMRLMIQLSNND